MAINEIADVEHFDRQCDSFPDVQSICNSSSAFVLPVFFCLGLLYSTPPSLPVVHLIFPPFYLLSVVPFSSLPLSFILNPLHFFPLPLPCLLFTKSIPTFSHCPPPEPLLSLSHPRRRYEVYPVCADLQGQILTCYKENVGKTLHCSNIAALYLQCVNNAKQVGVY